LLIIAFIYASVMVMYMIFIQNKIDWLIDCNGLIAFGTNSSPASGLLRNPPFILLNQFPLPVDLFDWLENNIYGIGRTTSCIIVWSTSAPLLL
jgi:hypothetical protein